VGDHGLLKLRAGRRSRNRNIWIAEHAVVRLLLIGVGHRNKVETVEKADDVRARGQVLAKLRVH
jgi:hypothetical protein